MEEAKAWLESMGAEERPVFLNLTPYNIVVQHPKNKELARWQRGENPASIVIEPPSEFKLFGSLVGVPMWYPSEEYGFDGLPLSLKANIIVTPDVGRLMRVLHYPWEGHVVSPDTGFGKARFQDDTWFVERMLYMRFVKEVKIPTYYCLFFCLILLFYKLFVEIIAILTEGVPNSSHT